MLVGGLTLILVVFLATFVTFIVLSRVGEDVDKSRQDDNSGPEMENCQPDEGCKIENKRMQRERMKKKHKNIERRYMRRLGKYLELSSDDSLFCSETDSDILDSSSTIFYCSSPFDSDQFEDHWLFSDFYWKYCFENLESKRKCSVCSTDKQTQAHLVDNSESRRKCSVCSTDKQTQTHLENGQFRSDSSNLKGFLPSDNHLSNVEPNHSEIVTNIRSRRRSSSSVRVTDSPNSQEANLSRSVSAGSLMNALNLQGLPGRSASPERSEEPVGQAGSGSGSSSIEKLSLESDDPDYQKNSDVSGQKTAELTVSEKLGGNEEIVSSVSGPIEHPPGGTEREIATHDKNLEHIPDEPAKDQSNENFEIEPPTGLTSDSPVSDLSRDVPQGVEVNDDKEESFGVNGGEGSSRSEPVRFAEGTTTTGSVSDKEAFNKNEDAVKEKFVEDRDNEHSGYAPEENLTAPPADVAAGEEKVVSSSSVNVDVEKSAKVRSNDNNLGSKHEDVVQFPSESDSVELGTTSKVKSAAEDFVELSTSSVVVVSAGTDVSLEDEICEDNQNKNDAEPKDGNLEESESAGLKDANLTEGCEQVPKSSSPEDVVRISDASPEAKDADAGSASDTDLSRKSSGSNGSFVVVGMQDVEDRSPQLSSGDEGEEIIDAGASNAMLEMCPSFSKNDGVEDQLTSGKIEEACKEIKVDEPLDVPEGELNDKHELNKELELDPSRQQSASLSSLPGMVEESVEYLSAQDTVPSEGKGDDNLLATEKHTPEQGGVAGSSPDELEVVKQGESFEKSEFESSRGDEEV